MQTPVGEHIRRLEERLELLNMQVMENRRALAERNQIESEIRAVNLALSHLQGRTGIGKRPFDSWGITHRRKKFCASSFDKGK
jgi:hypothetical protein